MRIRPYEHEDRPALLELNRKHSAAHGVEYLFSDPEEPLHQLTLVVEDEGCLIAQATGRATVEAMVTIDPLWGDPWTRWQMLRRLYDEAGYIGYHAGFREVHAAIPEHLRGYGRRLERELGFVRDLRERLILDLHARFGSKTVEGTAG